MTEPEPPAPKPELQLNTPPKTPAIADALRALGPDYEEALVDSIAARVDELARQREARTATTAPPVQSHPVQFPGAPAPLPITTPAPPPLPQPRPEAGPHHEHPHGGGGRGNAGLPGSILRLIFGFVVTVVALTAGLAISGPLALVAILIVWVALVIINVAVWQGGRR
jgi:hypothetical protein